MDITQSPSFRKYLEFCGWKSLPLSKNNSVYLFHFPFGNVMRVSRVNPLNLKNIVSLAKRQNVFLIKLELDRRVSDLEKYGFRKDTWSIEPTKTSIINLALNREQLFIKLKPKWRQNIRFALKKNIKVKNDQNINILVNVWQQNAKNKSHLIEKAEQTRVLWDEFRRKNSAFILTAYIKREPVASALLIFWRKTCHLWHLAYNGERSDLKPLYLLVWECILFAKKRHVKTFDFEGVADERFPYSKKTQSSYFKAGFGGDNKEYAGSYIKFFNPFWAYIYKIVCLINPGLFRRFFKSKPI